MDFVLWSIILGHCLLVTDATIVSTRYGRVRGEVASYPDATGPVKSVRRFLGIPYASPPVQELRFKAPEPPAAWQPDTYDARRYRSVCVQTDYFFAAIREFWPNFTKADLSEDCLYLNVFAPAENRSTPYPVMVYIHGGGYVFGTPVLNPSDQLVLHGMVVVTFQYRLGPFGFISTGDSAAPGNFGMLDQVQALQWVKDNIGAFGGDPTKVTIFGLSAGSASVALQLLSPLSKNLFQRAISESGVELSSWAFHKTSNAVYYTRLLAKKVGCEDADSKDIVECLRSKPATVLNGIGNLIVFTMNKYKDNAWSPVVDGRFLPDTPRAIRKAGTSVHGVPYLAGFTRHEGSVFVNATVNAVSGVSPDQFKKYLEAYSQPRSTSKTMASVISSALEFEYTPWPDAANSVSLREQLVHFITDSDYTAPTMAVLSSHSAIAPCYMYLFSHVSRQEKLPSWMGAKHGDTTSYIFGFPFMNSSRRRYDDVDRNVSRFMMTTWTNFATTGAPTPEPTDGVEWTRFNSSNLAYLEIVGSVPKMARNFRPRQVAFWNWYVPKLQNTKFDEEPPTTVSSAATAAPHYAALVSLLLGHFTLRTLFAVNC